MTEGHWWGSRILVGSTGCTEKQHLLGEGKAAQSPWYEEIVGGLVETHLKFPGLLEGIVPLVNQWEPCRELLACWKESGPLESLRKVHQKLWTHWNCAG